MISLQMVEQPARRAFGSCGLIFVDSPTATRKRCDLDAAKAIRPGRDLLRRFDSLPADR
jgi:hypothetical protein